MARERLIALILASCVLLPRVATCPTSPPGITVTCYFFDLPAEKMKLLSFGAHRLICDPPNRVRMEVGVDRSLILWLGYKPDRVDKVTLKSALSEPLTAEDLIKLTQ